MNNLAPGKHWYHNGIKLVLVGMLSLIVLGVVGFGVVVARYWWEIRSGRGVQLGQEIYSGFSSSVGNNTKVENVKRDQLETGDDPFLGNQNAELVVVEFVDFKCPNCLLEEPILKKVLAKYGNKIKLIVRDFPAESLHPGANQLALIASCAYQQGLYWSVHNWYFSNQSDLPEKMSDEEIRGMAENVGLDANKIFTCIKDNITGAEVNRDYADGFRFGVKGTPTFFINGERIEGVIPFETWDNFLKKIK